MIALGNTSKSKPYESKSSRAYVAETSSLELKKLIPSAFRLRISKGVIKMEKNKVIEIIVLMILMRCWFCKDNSGTAGKVKKNFNYLI
jgi:hypothetical protein